MTFLHVMDPICSWPLLWSECWPLRTQEVQLCSRVWVWGQTRRVWQLPLFPLSFSGSSAAGACRSGWQTCPAWRTSCCTPCSGKVADLCPGGCAAWCMTIARRCGSRRRIWGSLSKSGPRRQLRRTQAWPTSLPCERRGAPRYETPRHTGHTCTASRACAGERAPEGRPSAWRTCRSRCIWRASRPCGGGGESSGVTPGRRPYRSLDIWRAGPRCESSCAPSGEPTAGSTSHRCCTWTASPCERWGEGPDVQRRWRFLCKGCSCEGPGGHVGADAHH